MDEDPCVKIKKKSFGNLGKYTVYLVDDNIVRGCGKSAWEFSDYGVNLNGRGLPTLDFRFIPPNEIWLAESVAPQERHFILDTVAAYIGCIEAGMPSIKSYDKVMAIEKWKRKKDLLKKFNLTDISQLKRLTKQEIAPKLYADKYAKIKLGKKAINVFLVRGEVVRGLYKADFVEAGHGYVYNWIPKDEIWVDSSLSRKEVPVVVLHEFVERLLMKEQKLSYAKAHPMASEVEAKYRGRFNKEDMIGLGGYRG